MKDVCNRCKTVPVFNHNLCPDCWRAVLRNLRRAGWSLATLALAAVFCGAMTVI